MLSFFDIHPIPSRRPQPVDLSALVYDIHHRAARERYFHALALEHERRAALAKEWARLEAQRHAEQYFVHPQTLFSLVSSVRRPHRVVYMHPSVSMPTTDLFDLFVLSQGYQPQLHQNVAPRSSQRVPRLAAKSEQQVARDEREGRIREWRERRRQRQEERSSLSVRKRKGADSSTLESTPVKRIRRVPVPSFQPPTRDCKLQSSPLHHPSAWRKVSPHRFDDEANTLHEAPTLSTISPETHAAIAKLEQEFKQLQSSFTFPTHLDFASSNPTSTPTPHTNTSATTTPPDLLYTPANTQIHAYESNLTVLLTKLDAVESHGIALIRETRKRLVMAIEKELEHLAEEKARIWKNALLDHPHGSSNDLIQPSSTVDLIADQDQTSKTPLPKHTVSSKSSLEIASEASLVSAPPNTPYSPVTPLDDREQPVPHLLIERPFLNSAPSSPRRRSITLKDETTRHLRQRSASLSISFLPLLNTVHVDLPSRPSTPSELSADIGPGLDDFVHTSLPSSPIEGFTELPTRDTLEYTAGDAAVENHEADEDDFPESMEQSAHVEEELGFVLV